MPAKKGKCLWKEKYIPLNQIVIAFLGVCREINSHNLQNSLDEYAYKYNRHDNSDLSERVIATVIPYC